MRKSLIGLLVIGMALFTVSAQAVTVTLNPSSQSVAGGTTYIAVSVVVTGVASPGVDTLNFVLDFDPTLLSVPYAKIGPDDPIPPAWDNWMDIGEGYWSQGPELDNVNGQISFSLWNSGTGAATGSGTFAVLYFNADATNAGTAALEFTTWLKHPVPPHGPGGNMDHTDTPGDIIITEGPVIPEPATMMLVAAGLAALGGYARKKRS